MILLERISLVAILLTTVSACSSPEGDMRNSESLNVFGADDRETGDASLAPYKPIGRIGSGCTAFMVAPQLAVTAAHCIVESMTGAIKTTVGSFSTEYDLQKKPQITSRITHAWVGSFNPEEFRIKDWALLELATPVGLELGYLTVDPIDFSKQELPFSVASTGFQMGFEGGVKPGVDRNCLIHNIDDNGRLLNDCDSSPGISGGPIFSASTTSPALGPVVAVAVSEFRSGASTTVRRDEYTDDYANVAIPLNALASALEEAASTIQSGSERGNLTNAFHLTIPEPTPVTRNSIQLYATSSWSGGTFRDDLGQIRCSRPSTDCQGTYETGTRVVLTAPSTIVSFRQQGVFQYWLCSDARETFPGTNVCLQNGRDCTVVMRSDMICSAWYQ